MLLSELSFLSQDPASIVERVADAGGRRQLPLALLLAIALQDAPRERGLFSHELFKKFPRGTSTSKSSVANRDCPLHKLNMDACAWFNPYLRQTLHRRTVGNPKGSSTPERRTPPSRRLNRSTVMSLCRFISSCVAPAYCSSVCEGLPRSHRQRNALAQMIMTLLCKTTDAISCRRTLAFCSRHRKPLRFPGGR